MVQQNDKYTYRVTWSEDDMMFIGNWPFKLPKPVSALIALQARS